MRRSGSNSQTNYEIIDIDSSGVVSSNDSILTQDIKIYESNIFYQDIDGDESTGRDLTGITQVSTDITDILLYKDSSDNSFLIKDGSTYVPITNSSGESVSLETSSSSDKGYSSSNPIAIENENGTDLNSDGDDYGYYIAISINGIYESEGYSSWQVLYTDSNGVIDDNSILSMNSITNKEQEFEQDLNGDNSIE